MREYITIKMDPTSTYLHRRVRDYVDGLAELMEASVSELIEDMIKHVRDEDLEEDIWGDDFTDAMEELEESAEETETEEEE